MKELNELTSYTTKNPNNKKGENSTISRRYKTNKKGNKTGKAPTRKQRPPRLVDKSPSTTNHFPKMDCQSNVACKPRIHD